MNKKKIITAILAMAVAILTCSSTCDAKTKKPIANSTKTICFVQGDDAGKTARTISVKAKNVKVTYDKKWLNVKVQGKKVIIYCKKFGTKKTKIIIKKRGYKSSVIKVHITKSTDVNPSEESSTTVDDNQSNDPGIIFVPY